MFLQYYGMIGFAIGIIICLVFLYQWYFNVKEFKELKYFGSFFCVIGTIMSVVGYVLLVIFGVGGDNPEQMLRFWNRCGIIYSTITILFVIEMLLHYRSKYIIGDKNNET
ncbi:hypothetical protein SEPL_438 [Salmonella phage SE_PL]|uniref:hypothetical protein n=1 Tax=Salmonella enterica TaxID=28901 RepID=UPI000FDF86DC|nr:hypothetical protein CPT_Munch_531 [Salmonella phage Munch]EAZ2022792.1 hypothetical protein [Salmonella enterica]ECV9083927.1 hypothetical protein [Salmonella enterica subsp. enterica serovar Infantis]MCP0435472.1 hypothetical protein [Salmonella enterica subsp. enterica serovar Mbandaka]QCW18638.1 hypothetical protein 7t3_0117 [Salmonella phage 7t3]QIG63051.1 hypothetical protein SEPL_438 [Salmonella phage SE_PL]